MGSLFGITNEFMGLMSQIEDLGGEVTPELAEQLAINESNMATKCRAYFHIINQKEAEIKTAKEEQERLDGQIKAREGVINKLKKTLTDAVEIFGIIEPKAANKSINLGDLKIQHKKSISVEVNEGQVIDDERFCLKEAKFAMNYPQTKILTNLLNLSDFKVVPNITIKVQKDPLKKWLLENEEEHKVLIQQYNDEINKQVTDFDTSIGKTTSFSNEKMADVKLIKATTIKRNTTVQFK